MQPGVLIDKEVDCNFSLQVYCSEKREGLFVIKPVGSIDTMTSRAMQILVERICASKPNIIMFDLKRVDFINSKGLRVIIKVNRAVNALGGRVVLTNFQPHIKAVFEIINALPEQRIFSNWHEFDTYLESVQDRCADLKRRQKSEIETDNCLICAEIHPDQRKEIHSRMRY